MTVARFKEKGMPLYLQIIIAVICVAVLIAVIITVSVIAVRRKKSAVKSSAPSAVRTETNPAEKALPEPIERTPPVPETPVPATETERKSGTRLTLTDAKAKLSEKEKSYFSTLVSAMRSLEGVALKVSPYSYFVTRNEKTVAKLSIVAGFVTLDCTATNPDGKTARMRFKVTDEKSLHVATFSLNCVAKHSI